MNSDEKPNMSTGARVTIKDLGAPDQKPLPQATPVHALKRRRWLPIVLGGLCLLGLLSNPSTIESDNTHDKKAEAQDLVQNLDVCGEIERANDATAAEQPGQSPAESSSLPAGYTLVGVWPERSDQPVIYGVEHPDKTVEVCNNAQERSNPGAPSFQSSDDLGLLPEGYSYAYQAPTSAMQVELKLIGVRANDGTVRSSITLDNGSVRPKGTTL